MKKPRTMKLELKHLSPYLPYGLIVMCYTEGYPGEACTMITLSQNGLVGKSQEDGSNEIYHFEDAIPILRPLSDLTKEIEHNGERFVPALMLADPEKNEWGKMVCEEYNAFPKIPNYRKWVQVKHESLGQILSINPNNPEQLPHFLFKKLIEWHFDVFGLIDKNLAIDINTIEQ